MKRCLLLLQLQLQLELKESMKMSMSSTLEKGSSEEQLGHSQMLALCFNSSITLSFRLEQVLCIKHMQVWQEIEAFGWDTVFVQTL